MASRKTIILVAIFFALLAYVYFFEIKEEKKKQATKEKQEQVLNIDKERVSELAFLPAGITIIKPEAHWIISAPIRTKADQATIDNILDTFSRLKRDRFVSDNPNDFKKFGLSRYQSAFVINHDKSSDTLFLGDSNLDKTKVFCRKSGSNEVYLVPMTLATHATRTLYDLRDKSVFNFEQDNIQKLLIENKGQLFSCFKDRNQHWFLEQPIMAMCDEDKIADILNELKNSKVLKFVSEYNNDLKQYNLHHPWLTVTLFDTAQKKHNSLFVGHQENNNYYARDESRPAIFLVDSSLITQLNLSLFDLRDKTIVSFDQDSVTEILIKYPDYSFHCIQDSTKKWWLLQPDSGLIKSWKISSLFYDIKALKVVQFIDKPLHSDKFYGFDNPNIRLLLKQQDEALFELLVGDRVDDNTYVRNNWTRKTYQMSARANDKLVVKTDEFLEDNH